MKLNPPETAPKGAMILADFGHGLVPAIWSSYDKDWSVAEVEAYCPGDSYDEYRGFTNSEDNRLEMLGWLPLPKIDEDGNVV